ncbi:MAG: cyclic nucleotide-binding domain-containing protein [Phycisphaerales bacterium]|nr:cyclic nucleotide-binding domain-containing protein [Phycisphaerales bacterium]
MSVETMTVGAIGFVEKESRMIRNVLSLASNNEYTYQMVIGDQKSANLMIVNADDPAAMAVWNECFKIDPNRAVIFASTGCQFGEDHACIKRPLIASQLHGVLSLEGTRSGAASVPQKYQVLRKSFLFRNLSFSHLEKIVALSRPLTLPAEHVVFEMADAGAEMCVILKGRLKVSVANGEGREIVLGTVGPGEIIGEIAMLDGRGRSASAVTLTACDLLMIHREDFMPFLEQNPKAAIDLINVLALRLRLNTGQLAEFLIKETPPSQP